MKYKNGLMLMECGIAKNRWADYFHELLNVKDILEGDIVAVGGDVRMLVLGGNNVVAVTQEYIQEARK